MPCLHCILLLLCCSDALQCYWVKFIPTAAPAHVLTRMDWVKHTCYSGEEDAVFSYCKWFSMLSLLPARVHAAYLAVCRCWGGRVLDDSSQSVCAPLRCLSWRFALLEMPGVVWAETSAAAKHSLGAHSAESKQRLSPCVPVAG